MKGRLIMMNAIGNNKPSLGKAGTPYQDPKTYTQGDQKKYAPGVFDNSPLTGPDKQTVEKAKATIHVNRNHGDEVQRFQQQAKAQETLKATTTRQEAEQIALLKQQTPDEVARIKASAKAQGTNTIIKAYQDQVKVAEANLENAKKRVKPTEVKVSTAKTEVEELEAELTKARKTLNEARYESNTRKGELNQEQANRNSLDTGRQVALNNLSEKPKQGLLGLGGWFLGL